MIQDIRVNLRYNIKQLRKSNHLTQVEVAQYLKIDRSTYAYYEIGKTVPTIYTIQKIADFYEVPFDSLLFEIVS